MILVDNTKISTFTEEVEKSFLDSSAGALFFDKFIHRCLNNKYGVASEPPPSNVYVCPSMQDLLKKLPYPKQFNSDPGRNAVSQSDLGSITKIIHLDEYPTIDGVPIWRGNTMDGVQLLGIGYENGDNRYPCTLHLDDTDIHGVLGGATGHGKSVALNSVLFSMLMQYAPWELRVVLADAKVVEFKTIGIGKHIPHISGIAATTDADYIISVLQQMKTEMELRNAAFPEYGGSKNIKDFRKFTGWTLPQIVIIIDEFTAMFANAGKRAKYILPVLDAYGRLGRSTGIHMYLASQELGSDLPKATLNQIKIRCALGCSDTTSTQILGNDEAKIYFGQKGRLVINTNSPAGLKEENRHYRVPYLPSDQLIHTTNELNRIGYHIGHHYTLSFYNQDDMPDEEKYRKFVTENVTRDRIPLGEPSFVMEEADGQNYVKITFEREDSENIFVVSAQSSTCRRFLKMLDYATSLPEITHTVLTADKKLGVEMNFDPGKGEVTTFKSTVDNSYISTIGKGYSRKLLLDTDARVFPDLKCSDQAKIKLDSDPTILGNLDSELYRSRYSHMNDLFTTDFYMGAFNLKQKGAADREAIIANYTKAFVKYFGAYDSAQSKLTSDKFPVHYNWILGLEKVTNLGRESKPAMVEALKRVMQDSTEVNVRFIISTIATTDVKELYNACRFFLIDGLATRMQTDLKCADDYPEIKSNKLGILYLPQAEGEKLQKFKKMAFMGENIVD